MDPLVRRVAAATATAADVRQETESFMVGGSEFLGESQGFLSEWGAWMVRVSLTLRQERYSDGMFV
ncbi:hypothetical protein GCM10010321_58490 [Streptomyces chartreusis]|nr:hypothetical protein GCM10010321_58490 [Streptomyces chartreusis]